MKKALKILLAAAAVAQASVAQTADEYFMLGNSAYKAEDYKKAVENYDLAAGEGLDTSELYFNRANARVKTGEPARALADYLKALAMSPRMREASANLKILSQEASLQAPDMSSPFFELSKGEWFAVAVALFWICALTAAVPPLYGKGGKISWFIAAVAALGFAAGVCGVKKWSDFESLAVVVKQDAPMRLSPSPNAPIELRASEGLVVERSAERGDFELARAPNGKSGWIKKSDFAPISQ